MDMPSLVGLRAAIIGVAREGTALARYLAEAGATVTLSDIKPAERLISALDGLAGLSIRLTLGGHPADLLDVDVLFLSPGVPLSAPIVRQAQDQSIPISSEPRLFTQLFPNPILGITGSSGKTTTTALVGEMLSGSGDAGLGWGQHRHAADWRAIWTCARGPGSDGVVQFSVGAVPCRDAG